MTEVRSYPEILFQHPTIVFLLFYIHPPLLLFSSFFFVLSYLILASFPFSVLSLSSIVFFYPFRFPGLVYFFSSSSVPNTLHFVPNDFTFNFALGGIVERKYGIVENSCLCMYVSPISLNPYPIFNQI